MPSGQSAGLDRCPRTSLVRYETTLIERDSIPTSPVVTSYGEVFPRLVIADAVAVERSGRVKASTTTLLVP